MSEMIKAMARRHIAESNIRIEKQEAVVEGLRAARGESPLLDRSLALLAEMLRFRELTRWHLPIEESDQEGQPLYRKTPPS